MKTVLICLLIAFSIGGARRIFTLGAGDYPRKVSRGTDAWGLLEIIVWCVVIALAIGSAP